MWESQFPGPRIGPVSPASSCTTGRFFTCWAIREASMYYWRLNKSRRAAVNDGMSPAAHLPPLDVLPALLLPLPLQLPLLLQLLFQLQLSFALLLLPLPLLPLLLRPLQLGQALLLFTLLLQECLSPLLQLQVAPFKVLPLLIFKGYFQTRDRMIMKSHMMFNRHFQRKNSMAHQQWVTDLQTQTP